MKKITLFAIFSIMVIAMSAQNSMTYTFTAPITVEQGEMVTLNYTYTADAEYEHQVQIFKSTDPSIFGNGASGTGIDPGVLTNFPAATDMANSVVLSVPSDLILTADLENGEKYYLFGKIEDDPDGFDDTYWSVAGNYPEIIVVPSTLSINEFKEAGVTWFVKNNNLTINGAMSGKEMRIFDVSGRTMLVAPIKGDINTFNISGLSSGVYVAVTDAGSFKFAK